MRATSSLVVVVASLSACGEAGLEPANLPDLASLDGGGPLGWASDAAAPPPSALPNACGDGVLSADELCDGDTVACNSLGAVFAAGAASCRKDCSGYDISTCTASAQQQELVYPAKRLTRFDDARCNDGTPFDFEIALSPSGSKRWVIYLQGGGFCDGTYGKCTTRASLLTSSSGRGADRSRPTTFDSAVTIFDRDPANNPEFFDATFVRAHYCSSDLWTGTNATPQAIRAKGGQQSWVFMGHRNVTALLDILRRNYGLADADADVLFAGGSAGGFGAAQNVDQLAERMPLATREGRIAFMGTSFWNTGTWADPDYTMFGSGKAEVDVTSEILKTFAGTPNSRCLPLAVAAGLPASACLAGPLVHAAITKPAPVGLGVRALIGQNRVDQLYMGQHGIPSESALLSAKERAARDAWKQQMTLSLEGVLWVYAPADPHRVGEDNLHGVFNDAALWTYSPNGDGRSAKAVVSAFWRDRASTTGGLRVIYDGETPHGRSSD